MGTRDGVLVAFIVVALACETTPVTTAPAPADAGAAGVPTSGFSEASMRAALLAFNTKYCAVMERCDKPLFDRIFANVSACLGDDRPREELAELFSAPGVTATPESLLACAAVIKLETCEDFARFAVEGFLPEACRSLGFGTLPDDSPCVYWNQCQSGRCFGPLNGTANACGVCTPQVREGAACSYSDSCEAGSVCRPDGARPTKCKPWGEIGAPCGPDDPCHVYLVCANGTCAVPAADDACDPPGIECTTLPSFRRCDPSSKRCVRLDFGKDGDPCGDCPGGPFVPCGHGLTCTKERATDGGAPSLFCRPQIELGGTCLLENHPNGQACKQGACFRQVCELRGPAHCTPATALP